MFARKYRTRARTSTNLGHDYVAAYYRASLFPLELLLVNIQVAVGVESTRSHKPRGNDRHTGLAVVLSLKVRPERPVHNRVLSASRRK